MSEVDWKEKVIRSEAKVAVTMTGNYREALNVIDILAKKLGRAAPVEIQLAYALLLSIEYIGMDASEVSTNKKHARDILERIHERYLKAKEAGADILNVITSLGGNHLTFVLLAKLWQEERVEKAIEAYKTAIEVHTLINADEGTTATDLVKEKMTCNLGVLYHVQGNVDSALSTLFDLQKRLVTMEETDSDGSADSLRTTVLYNVGRCFEEDGDLDEAISAYELVLRKHPEYLNGEYFRTQITAV